jgi:hypothetical protein
MNPNLDVLKIITCILSLTAAVLTEFLAQSLPQLLYYVQGFQCDFLVLHTNVFTSFKSRNAIQFSLLRALAMLRAS